MSTPTALAPPTRPDSTDEAVRLCVEAARLQNSVGAAPNDISLRAQLAHTLLRLSRADEAAAQCAAILAIAPDDAPARDMLVRAQARLRHLNEEIVHHQRPPTRDGIAKVLECLYGLNQLPDFNRFLVKVRDADPVNIRAAAIAAFAAQQTGAENIFPFCRAPMDLISIVNIASELAPWDAFASALNTEIAPDAPVWEPHARSTRQGFQTLGNLFDLKGPKLTRLEALLRRHIAAYVQRFAHVTDNFIARWPTAYQLSAWHVRLLQGGHQMAHIHPTGWLSGVLYLNVPTNFAGEEGAIEFGLHGYDYPIRTPEMPRRVHKPAIGDLVLFPSCLFHRTIPFSADTERHSLAFDLQPLS